MNVCFCCARFTFFGSRPRDWLGLEERLQNDLYFMSSGTLNLTSNSNTRKPFQRPHSISWAAPCSSSSHWFRKRISGHNWTRFFDMLEALRTPKQQCQSTEGNSDYWPQPGKITHWSKPFVIHRCSHVSMGRCSSFTSALISDVSSLL